MKLLSLCAAVTCVFALFLSIAGMVHLNHLHDGFWPRSVEEIHSGMLAMILAAQTILLCRNNK